MRVLESVFERLLGLDRGFFAAEGDLHFHFDPHWPGPLLGSSGSVVNYFLAAISLALLIIFMRRDRRLPRGLAALAFCGALIWPVALLILHLNVWSVLLAAVVVAGLAYAIYRGRGEAILILARLALLGLYFSVISGTIAWNVSVAGLALLVVLYVYRREGRSTQVRISLGLLRTALIAFVLLLLNGPILTRIRTVVEPSVVAILVDDTLSMKVRDVQTNADASGPTRLEAVTELLTGEDRKLIKSLAKVHTLQFFTFAQNAKPLGVVPGISDKAAKEAAPTAENALVQSLTALQPTGTSTQIVPSLLTVLDALQGQRLAGVVVLTDGRDTPTSPPLEVYKTLKSYGIRVYPIGVGSEKSPTNVEVQSIAMQDSAFKDDIVNVKAVIRATGYGAKHPVHIKATDKRTGLPLRDAEGHPVEKTVDVSDDQPVEEELLFKPDQAGAMEVRVEAERQPGEIDEQDNVRTAAISILDAQIAVLYVDGYPRWEYRYIKNEMIRDKTVDISCLLTSADQTFAQEGDPPNKATGFPGRITRFPESLDELMPYDVVLFGDVDPRQFTDRQLQLVNDFVARKGGGFGMIAGPRWSPLAFRNTPIEAILPVNISHVQPDDPSAVFDQGFRPILTKEGVDSSMFRFFPDRQQNAKFMKDDLQPLFWYSRGVIAKPGLGIVYAEHPTDVGPDGHKAPLLVLSHFGAGLTLFSAFDDSWRWRFYTGESVFDTFWVQQLRWLARGKKLGQRRITFAADRQQYELGQQVRLTLKVLDPVLLQQLPPEFAVQVRDEHDQPIRTEKLQKQQGAGDYVAAFAADHLGHFQLKLPSAPGDAQNLDATIDVIEPKLELSDPRINRTSLGALATESFGQTVAFESARDKLPGLIPSAARTTLIPLDLPLWNAPAAMVIFVLLLTSEWVLRKVYGML